MNKPQSNSAQIQGKTTIPFTVKSNTKPDFNHRLNSYSEGEYCLEDAAYHALEQAHSIINFVQIQFTGESVQLSDDLNFYTLEAARNAILDVKAIVSHYSKNAGGRDE